MADEPGRPRLFTIVIKDGLQTKVASSVLPLRLVQDMTKQKRKTAQQTAGEEEKRTNSLSSVWTAFVLHSAVIYHAHDA